MATALVGNPLHNVEYCCSHLVGIACTCGITGLQGCTGLSSCYQACLYNDIFPPTLTSRQEAVVQGCLCGNHLTSPHSYPHCTAYWRLFRCNRKQWLINFNCRCLTGVDVMDGLIDHSRAVQNQGMWLLRGSDAVTAVGLTLTSGWFEVWNLDHYTWSKICGHLRIDILQLHMHRWLQQGWGYCLSLGRRNHWPMQFWYFYIDRQNVRVMGGQFLQF